MAYSLLWANAGFKSSTLNRKPYRSLKEPLEGTPMDPVTFLGLFGGMGGMLSLSDLGRESRLRRSQGFGR